MSQIPEQRTNKATIIGSGLTGRSIAILTAQKYAAAWRETPGLAPLDISIIDPNRDTVGIAYDTKDNYYLLNQPASAMSPFPEDPDHFTRHSGQGPDHFATRKEYGQYIKTTFDKVFDDLKCTGQPVHSRFQQNTATSFTLAPNNITVGYADGALSSTDVLALATGHVRSDFLSHLADNPRYFAAPCNAQSAKDTLKQTPNAPVGIIGSGQSMLDALSTLDNIGHKGKIYVISPNLVTPWAFHPERHRPDSAQPPYQPAFLTPARVAEEQRFTAQDLHDLLKKDIARAEKQGYDVDQVVTRIDIDGLSTAGPRGATPVGLPTLRQVVQDYYGNPTPEQRRNLFQKYAESGQIELVQGRVAPENVLADAKGFRLSGLGPSQRSLSIGALFNGAAFTRNPFAHPLIRQARDKGVLRPTFNHAAPVAPGVQKDPRLFIGGPAVHPATWGVESFRETNAAIARGIVDHFVVKHTTTTQATHVKRRNHYVR